MFIKNLKIWFRAIRPFSFTGSIIPVTLGAILSIKESRFQVWYFIFTLIAIILLHSSVNLLSDHDDFENKVDTKGSYGSSGVIFDNLLSSKQLCRAGYILLTLGTIVGIFLSYERGLFILVLGLVGAFGGYSYTGKPLSLKYRGLGAPTVFLLFGPLMVIGSYYVQMQRISAEAFFISIPIGLLTTAILHANDIRDILHDKESGIKTLSIIVGKRCSKIIYCCLLIIPYICILMLSIYTIIPYWSLTCLITIPSAYKNIRKLYSSGDTASSIANLDKDTAQFHAKFSTILTLSLLVFYLII
jgi:1,4-dihydroxy-2-naphthoate polyprenyltransferase